MLMKPGQYLPVEEPRQGQSSPFTSVQVVAVRQPGVIERICQLGPVKIDELVCLWSISKYDTSRCETW